MNKKMNSFTKIITVLLALLLLGIAAGPASAVSGTNAAAVAITSSAVANHSAAVNISFNTANSTLGNWSVNITNPLNTSSGQLNSGWINISSANLTTQLSVVGLNNTLLRTGGFNNSNGTIYVLLNTSNATDPNTFNVTFQNLDNLSENVTVPGLKFVAGPIATVTITNISTQAVANNSNKFAMNASAFDAQNNPILSATISLTSNRTQDTITPASVTTNATTGAVANFNVTSTLAGQTNITGKSTVNSVTANGSSTNVVFVAGPAAQLAFFGANSAAGTTVTTPGTTTQTIAVQDAFGNNVTSLASNTLITLTKTGSATFPSLNMLTINSSNINNISNNVLNINTTGVFNSTFVVNDTVVETPTIGANPNATFSAISKNIQFFGPVSKVAVTLSKSSLNANTSDTLVATAQLQDAANNSITASGISVTLTANNASLLTITPPSNNTDANGATTFTVKANAISGSTFLTAIDTSGNNGNSPTVTLNQALNITNSAVVNDTNGAIKTGANSTITATINDYNSVAISAYPVTFNITTGDATFANNGLKVYTTTTASTGNATALITSINASTLNVISVNVTINDENGVTKQVGSLQNFTVTPGSPTQYVITPGTSVGLTNIIGTTQVFNITVKDSVGNLNSTAGGQINITTDNQALGNMSNGTTTVLNNLTVTMTGGNASFTYNINSTTVGTAVLTLNSSALGIVNTTVTITTSGATGIALTVNKSVQNINSDVLALAQLTGPTGTLSIADTSISFVVTNSASVIQQVGTSVTNSSGIANFSFNQSTAGVYTVTASSSTLGLSNSTTVTFAGPAASIVATANNTAPAVNTTVMINVTVKDASGVTSGALDNTLLQFLAGSGTLGSNSVMIQNGVASTTYTRATAGAVTITAFYNATLQNTTTVTFTSAGTPTPTPTPTPTTAGPQLVLTLTPGAKAANFSTAVLLDTTSAIVESASSISGDGLTATFNLSGITPGFYFIEVNGLTGDRVPTFIDNNTINQNQSVTGTLTGSVIGDASNPTKYRIKARSGGRHPVVNFATGLNESKLPFIMVYNTSVQKIEIRVVNTSELLTSFTPAGNHPTGPTFQDWQFGSNNHGIVYNNTDSSCNGCHVNMNTKPASYTAVATTNGWCFKCHYGGTNGGDSNGFVDSSVLPTSNSSITGVTLTPTTPIAGSEMNITVAINNPGASFNGRVEGNVWLPDGSGKYLGWETVVIPSGASTVTITGAAGGNEASFIPHTSGAYLYDVFLENVDKGQVYTNFTDAKTGVAFTVGTSATVYISNVVLSSAPRNGSVMTLNVTITNPTTSAFTGTMDSNIWDSASGHVLPPQNISIAASGSTTLTFTYTPVKTGLHSYDFFMLSPGQNTLAPWGFPCMDYVAGIGFNVV